MKFLISLVIIAFLSYLSVCNCAPYSPRPRNFANDHTIITPCAGEGERLIRGMCRKVSHLYTE